MRKLLALLLAGILFIQLPVSALASFDDQQGGARAPGMANAYTAVADDADSIPYNPAGLIQLNEGQITSQYGQISKGLNDGSSLGTTYLGYAYPLTRGYRALGIAYHNFKADNLLNERTIILSYGQRVNADLFGWGGIWSGGVNLKQLHREYIPDRFTENALNDAGTASGAGDPLFASGNAKDTYAVDLGGLLQFGQNYQYTAGVSIINANQPDVSLAGDGDKAPMSLRMAAAYRPRWGTLTVENRRTNRLETETDSDFLFGAERNMPFASLGAIILRGGYGTGSRGFRSITMGLSYLYSRFRLDYAFAFPIDALSETQGTHRVGLAVKLGSSSDEQLSKDYTDADLIKAFAYDSLTTHILITRLSLSRNFSAEQKNNLMLLLVRRYPLDDPGLNAVRNDLRDLVRKSVLDSTDWTALKFALVKGMSDADKAQAMQSVELLVKGDLKGSLARLALLSVPLQRNDRASSIAMMALAELAAQAYRSRSYDSCIDYVRRMLEILPSDEMVMRAYRQLLALRSSIADPSQQSVTDETPIKVQEELPQAPQTLVAPKPVTTETATKPVMSEFETMVRAYGNSLGYYLSRKAVGASVDERRTLLEQMKATYRGTNVDLSIVDRELAELPSVSQPTAQPVVVPVEQPVVTPVVVPATPKPVTKPAAKPAVAPTPTVKQPVAKPAIQPAGKPAVRSGSALVNAMPKELERAWQYYHDVSDRNISDHERIELLEAMLKQFGEKGAERVNKELSRIRKRVQ